MEIIDICRMVARSLFAEIGPWGNQCAFFGGLVPGWLVPQPDPPLQPHVGTRDIDLAIRVAAIGDEKDMYRTLKRNLSQMKLTQTKDRSFEWKRSIEGFDIIVELFVPVDDPAQGGRIQQKPIEKSGSGLTALGIFGLDLMKLDIVELEDEGPLLDNQGVKKVKLRACGPAMLVALKAWALKDRIKSKDGYDVVWLLKAFGCEEIGRRFKEAKLQETEFGIRSLEYLSDCFKTYEHTGPAGWVEESHFPGGEHAIEAREAVAIVREFIRIARE